MSYFIIHNALQQSMRGPQGPRGPMSRAEVFVMAVITVIVVVVVTGLVIIIVQDVKQTDRMEAAWDAGKGRPSAVQLTRSPEKEMSVDVPETIKQVDNAWSQCTHKNCRYHEIGHFPTVYPIGRLKMDGNCYNAEPGNTVTHLMVAATPHSAYRVSYSPDGKKLAMCATSPRHDDDKLVIWSDDKDAPR